MESANVKVLISKKDEVSVELKDYKDAKALSLDYCLIKEEATARGRTAVGFYVVDQKTGERYYVNTTGRLLNAMAAACRGAMQRFGDDPDKS